MSGEGADAGRSRERSANNAGVVHVPDESISQLSAITPQLGEHSESHGDAKPSPWHPAPGRYNARREYIDE